MVAICELAPHRDLQALLGRGGETAVVAAVSAGVDKVIRSHEIVDEVELAAAPEVRV